MKGRLAASLLCFAVVGAAAQAPTPSADDAFLDELAGAWILEGVIAGRPTTHDVTAEWVLAHQYLRIHEVSRERNDKGEPRYEAIVFVSPNRKEPGEYALLWLDTTMNWATAFPSPKTGDRVADGVGRGRREGDTIPFTFRDKAGNVSFTNTFVLDRAGRAWSWNLDNVGTGGAKPFARLKLSRPG